MGRSEDDLRFIEAKIHQHRYYESFGVWTPSINLDKRITAGIVRAFDPRSAIELGCFNGSVLSLLDDAQIDVTGVEISHLAFLLAQSWIYHKIRYGNLTEIAFDRQFDVFYAMDILEHISPLDLDSVVSRIADLVQRQGVLYVNSPMFGVDDVFGEVFGQYVSFWREAGDERNWLELHCDEAGWPMHGHLVWASPKWSEALFLRHGLVRDRAAERAIHDRLSHFFSAHGPARKSLFVLRHRDAEPLDHDAFRVRLNSLIDEAEAADRS